MTIEECESLKARDQIMREISLCHLRLVKLFMLNAPGETLLNEADLIRAKVERFLADHAERSKILGT